jgi:hypothetical protein
MFPPQLFMPTFWMLVVAKPLFREDPENIDDEHGGGKDLMEWQERHWAKTKFNEIRRMTGCRLVLCEAQPEFDRPHPFYYIQGTFWGVNQATFLLQKMMCERQTEKLEDLEERLDVDRTWIFECDYIEMPSPHFPLWKAVGLTEEATKKDIIEVLNSWCLEGTRIYTIGCIPHHDRYCKCSSQSNDPTIPDNTIHIEGVLKSQIQATREHLYKGMLTTLL